jgi:hypothetical protein
VKTRSCAAWAGVSFCIRDERHALAYVLFEDEKGLADGDEPPLRDEARRIAANIAKAAGVAAQAMGHRKLRAAFLGPARGLRRRRLSAKLTGGTAGEPMDRRIESFLADVLALDEEPDEAAGASVT